jgi:hypothetical protein
MAEKAVESANIEIDWNTKTPFTLIGSIAVKGDGLPLFLTAKGMTARCHKQFGQSFSGSIDQSKSSWVNQELFLRILSFIQSNYGRSPVALVLDRYPAHMTLMSHAKAREVGIKLILVSKIGTVRYQPLDRRIYKVLKPKVLTKIDRISAIEHNLPVMKEAGASSHRSGGKSSGRTMSLMPDQLRDSSMIGEHGRQYMRTKQNRPIRR